MQSYHWICQACDTSNAGSEKKCTNCACPSECNAIEIDLYKLVYKHYSINGIVKCPKCHKRTLSAKYDQDPHKYFYKGLKRRSWLFRILHIEVNCVNCDLHDIIEHIVPMTRRIYRLVTKKDIKNTKLKRI